MLLCKPAFIREKSRKGAGQQRKKGQHASTEATGHEDATTRFKIVLTHERVRKLLFENPGNASISLDFADFSVARNAELKENTLRTPC
ncbi:MAG: hypothetical protein GTN81_04700 [Proteobacteria bacterium]|nr:hypothetical protein [Pseudomonadota bacterium]